MHWKHNFLHFFNFNYTNSKVEKCKKFNPNNPFIRIWKHNFLHFYTLVSVLSPLLNKSIFWSHTHYSQLRHSHRPITYYSLHWLLYILPLSHIIGLQYNPFISRHRSFSTLSEFSSSFNNPTQFNPSTSIQALFLVWVWVDPSMIFCCFNECDFLD